MNANVEVVARYYAAINRNDMQAIADDFDPEIVRTEPAGFPTAGSYRGLAEVQDHIRQGRGTWAEGSCEPEGYFAHGDKVVVYLHAWVRLRDRTEWSGGRFADGLALQGGKIIEYHSFADRAQALQWAGIDAVQQPEPRTAR
jgi:ketosteroid isomerase-like protein